MSATSRRNVRLRREYLYSRSLEGKERELFEKKRRVREALAAGKPIPTDLVNEETELRRLLAYDDASMRAPDAMLDNEYAQTLRGERMPKICITTSRAPSSRLKQFAKELKHLFPNANTINRGNTKIAHLADATRRAEFSDIIIVHETRGQPDGLVISHLPVGPTTYFTVSNCVLRHDIEDAPNFSTDSPPHLIFHNFDANKRLANRICTILKCLFPVPRRDAKRIATFYNSDDVIAFRHHTITSDVKPPADILELGPRFDLFPYQIKLGCIDEPHVDVEWVLRPYLNRAASIL
mmetsp:Transcript_15988/g.23985  ORF Transcript_15988/g.23985 Transcript_15988/m.23985 type:complete len:294 (-) Transcript_15988:1907-2788(-)|eukprot:CAMPEP_0197311386 /NCGR_PEP_ID=MMETSP0891-20130614/9857_1 /TAXON_ID=44058 ORGANISM="Aureoumbra lagunensis, Strain CCMP1510" /NCGR_SAMPLE_ID=MMETSP0891 /ASSEMBLY_ACC=CAM_ASM_000534 /LENGTH=293 /DNA_ID=CAMNT_0042797469 /DNA_START=29 /DNA_END=910 /DNA_ORIENTATION=-